MTTPARPDEDPAPSGGPARRPLLPAVGTAVGGAVAAAAVLLVKLLWFDRLVSGDGIAATTTVASLGTVLLLTCWLPLLRLATAAAWALVLDFLVSAAIVADLLYVRFFDGLVTVPTLLQTGDVSNTGSSVTGLLRPADLLFFADLPVLLALWWLLRRRTRPLAAARTPSLRRRLVAAVCVATAGSLVLGGYTVDIARQPWAVAALTRNGSQIPAYRVAGLVGFHLYDAYRFAAGRISARDVSHAEVSQVASWLDGQRDATGVAPDGPRFGEFRGRNVLVVQLEAFQSFVVGRSVEGQEITPNLNRLAGRSVYFSEALHQTAGGGTSDAELLAGCSLHPAAVGAAFSRFADHDYRCLPEILRGHGYSTAAHHANDPAFYDRARMYPAMGYQRFFSLGDYTQDEPLGWTLGDRSFLRQTVAQLRTRPQPFYDLAITITSHFPFDVPRLPTHLDVGDLEGTPLGDYLQVVHYTDSAIGRLVDQLRRAGLWSDTIVVMYGDHNNHIDDPRLYRKLFGHPLSPYEAARLQHRIPMLIHLPGDAYAGTVHRPVGQIDLPPTLSYLLGIPPDGSYAIGQNAFTPRHGPVVFRDGGFSGPRYLFVPSRDGDPSGDRCFAHATGRLTARASCRAGAAAAEAELSVSDRLLEENLVPLLQRR